MASTTDRVARNLTTIIDDIDRTQALSIRQAQALQVLRQEIEASPWVSDLVANILAGGNRRYTLPDLALLLSLFGVGTIVEGRLQ